MIRSWETKMRNKEVFMYFLAPFLEEAGLLLLATKCLWHPWSVKRREELSEISCSLKNRARTLRERGLVWVSNEFGKNPSYLLSSAKYYRYHNDDDPGPSCPHAAPYTAHLATEILFLLLPIFKKIEEESSYEEKGWVKWLSEIIEKIVESSYYTPSVAIADDLIKMVGIHGLLVECEGLAYTQAIIEDSFDEQNPNRKRKKKSDLSNAELGKLAAEIDTPFETVKDVFETKFSSWWEQVEKYENQARAQREKVLSSLSLDSQAKEIILAAWDPGMIIDDGSPVCWSSRELEKSERIIKTFISMFTSWIATNEKEINQRKRLVMSRRKC